MPVVGKPFKRGHSGNPKGRPKTDFNLKAECLKLIPKVFEFYQEVLNDPHARKEHKIKIAETLLDRGFGKAIQPNKDLGQGESWEDFWRSV